MSFKPSHSKIPCNNGKCRGQGEFKSTEGFNYCKKCSLKFVKSYGINFFWVHYHHDIRTLLRNEEEDQ